MARNSNLLCKRLTRKNDQNQHKCESGRKQWLLRHIRIFWFFFSSVNYSWDSVRFASCDHTNAFILTGCFLPLPEAGHRGRTHPVWTHETWSNSGVTTSEGFKFWRSLKKAKKAPNPARSLHGDATVEVIHAQISQMQQMFGVRDCGD